MDLVVFHRILISAAILFDVFFTVFCIRMYNATNDGWHIVWAVMSSLLVVAFAWYLVHFNRKTARLQEQLKETSCPSCGYNLRGMADKEKNACPECGKGISEELRRKVATA